MLQAPRWSYLRPMLLLLPFAVGIVGASGYTGAEMLRLLAQHPQLELKVATGDSMAGRRASDLYPSLHGAYPDLVFTEFDPAAVDGLDLVFLGLPHGASMELAPSLVGEVGCVVDLSAAFRLQDAAAYPTYYGFEHTEGELLAAGGCQGNTEEANHEVGVDHHQDRHQSN